MLCASSWRRWWRQRHTKMPKSSWNALTLMQRKKLWAPSSIPLSTYTFFSTVYFILFIFILLFSLFSFWCFFFSICSHDVGVGVHSSPSSDDSQAGTRYDTSVQTRLIKLNQTGSWKVWQKWIKFLHRCRDSSERGGHETHANGVPSRHGNDSCRSATSRSHTRG